MFEKFLDKEGGKLEESLGDNVRGLLSLYEASHYGTHGEEILDVALEFSFSRLESMVSNINNASLAAQVKEALGTPIHKSLTCLHAAKFIPTYQEEESHNETLLTFAKMDFNFVQMMHQKEISEITRLLSTFYVNLQLVHSL